MRGRGVFAPNLKLLKANQDVKKWNWQTMARDPVVYVRDKISHPGLAVLLIVISLVELSFGRNARMN